LSTVFFGAVFGFSFALALEISFPPLEFRLPKIPLLNRNGDKLYDVTPQEAANLLEHHQARYAGNRRCLVAVGFIREHEHPCRTRTSRGGLLAAIGRGQQYTTSTHGRVDGFKRIFLEDLGTFNAATLDCVKVGHWRVISIEIQAIPAGAGKMSHVMWETAKWEAAKAS
jgi:hypothetical protein